MNDIITVSKKTIIGLFHFLGYDIIKKENLRKIFIIFSRIFTSFGKNINYLTRPIDLHGQVQ